MNYDIEFDDDGNIILDDGIVHKMGRVRVALVHLPTALQNGWTETVPSYRDQWSTLVWRSSYDTLSTKDTFFKPRTGQ